MFGDTLTAGTEEYKRISVAGQVSTYRLTTSTGHKTVTIRQSTDKPRNGQRAKNRAYISFKEVVYGDSVSGTCNTCPDEETIATTTIIWDSSAPSLGEARVKFMRSFLNDGNISSLVQDLAH